MTETGALLLGYGIGQLTRRRRTAAVGIPVAVLAGLPLEMMTAQLWTSPPLGAVALAGTLHALGGLGYAAAFGLLAVRIGEAPGWFARAVRACGRRSLSCYLAFAALLPAGRWASATGRTCGKRRSWPSGPGW